MPRTYLIFGDIEGKLDVLRVRLLPSYERAAFREMLAHELRGRELDQGELRRVAERALAQVLERGHAARVTLARPRGAAS